MYQDNNAYSFDMFESHERTPASQNRNTARKANAPEIKQPGAKPQIRRVEPKTRKDKNTEAKRTSLKAIVLMGFMGVVFFSACMHISAVAEHHELAGEIAAVEAQIENAKSENVRLNAELNGITSISRIDSYATRILGMTKLERYQVECINLSEGDKVLYTASNKLFGGIKAAEETAAPVDSETVAVSDADN